MSNKKLRVDQLLVERGLAESRAQAQRFVMAGQVRVEGERVHKSSALAERDADLQVEGGPQYVSRAGFKLEAALTEFGIDPKGLSCADVGASTGGFTDCLLQKGARRVYAIDVGKGQLHWKLRQDERVVVMEEINARYLDELPGPVSLVTVDVSFISARKILPKVTQWIDDQGQVVVLIKPQFEAGPEQVGKGGIVTDPEVQRATVRGFFEGAKLEGLHAFGLIRSPVLGAKGNQEYLACLRPLANERPVDEWMESVLKDTLGSAP